MAYPCAAGVAPEDPHCRLRLLRRHPWGPRHDRAGADRSHRRRADCALLPDCDRDCRCLRICRGLRVLGDPPAGSRSESGEASMTGAPQNAKPTDNWLTTNNLPRIGFATALAPPAAGAALA